ncbi:MAG: universal stress protein [Candidatus Eremiobacteraeota bacterium]|nr:universal stress protein [Candidatus Eremiobacteraeota bacterium]
MITSILVAVDSSEAAQAALREATEIAKKFSARLVLVNIVDVTKLLTVAGYETPYPVDAIELMRNDAKTILDEAMTTCTNCGITSIELTGEGDAVDEILNAAKDERVDMIALGTHGRQGLSRLFLGSVAEGVLRRADVPVLVVRS